MRAFMKTNFYVFAAVVLSCCLAYLVLFCMNCFTPGENSSINTTYTHHYCSELASVSSSGQPFRYENEVDLRIIVLTFNRSKSLQHTLNNLQRLVLDDARVALEIWIDCSAYGFIDGDTYEVASSFIWEAVSVRVNVWSEHVGLYGQWINTWSPYNGTNETALFVEDDMDIAPYAWRWLQAVQIKYKWMSNLCGYGLKDEDLSKAAKKVIRYDSVFMRRHHLPWGFAPVPQVWRQFQQWYRIKKDDPQFHPYISEDKIHTHWYKELEKQGREKSMWTQWFHYFTHKKGLYCIFPNIRKLSGDHRGLEFNRREEGLHFTSKQSRISSTKNLISKWKEDYVIFPKRTKILNYNDRLLGIVLIE